MADLDFSDVAVKETLDFSDVAQKETAPEPAPAPTPAATIQRKGAIRTRETDFSDVAELDTPAPKAYSITEGNVHFDSARPATGLKQAVEDGVIAKDWAETHQKNFEEAQNRFQDLQDAAGGASQAKAFIHGAGVGGAFLAGSIPGARIGAMVGTAAVGGPEDPLAAIAAPVGAAVGALATGTPAAWAARAGIQKAGEYNDFIKSFSAAAELHPVLDSAGELTAFATSAPKAIGNLVKLGRVASAGGESATKAVASQLAKGAAGGAAFEGIIRPAFDIGRNAVADVMGIKHDEFQAPSLSSLAQNVGLGILTAGHSVTFRDFSGPQITDLIIRGQAREDAGVPLNDDRPESIEKAKAALSALAPQAEPDTFEPAGLLKPMTPEEVAMYAKLKDAVEAFRAAGKVGQEKVTGATGRQAAVRGLFGRKIPISSAALTTEPIPRIEPKGELNAPNPVVEPQSNEPERQGTDEVGQTPPKAGGSDRLPGAAGQPAASDAQVPIKPGPILNVEQAENQIIDGLMKRGEVGTGDFTGEGIRKALNVPAETDMQPLVDAGLLHRSEPGVYQFNDSIQKKWAAQFKARTSIDAGPPTTGGPPQAPAPPNHHPSPEWTVTVQKGQTLEKEGKKTVVPGYIQIDDMTGGANHWSSNPDALKAKGWYVDKANLELLPTGKYTYGEAMAKATQIRAENSTKAAAELERKALEPDNVMEKIRQTVATTAIKAADIQILANNLGVTDNEKLLAEVKKLEADGKVTIDGRLVRLPEVKPEPPKEDTIKISRVGAGPDKGDYLASVTDGPNKGMVGQGKDERMARARLQIKIKIKGGALLRQGKVGDMLASGEQVLTSSGRPTTPFPKFKTETERQTSAAVRAVDAWLRENAIAEAESRSDEFNARQFRSENPKSIPQASKDSMEEYLFGTQPTVPKPFLKPVSTAPEPDNELRALITSDADMAAKAQTIKQLAKARGLTGKEVQEQVEFEIVRMGDQIARDPGMEPRQKMVAQMGIYRRQPVMSGRNSTSVELQSYSTPLPLAYAAGYAIMADPSASSYDATAGNAMLLINSNLETSQGNELQKARADNLRKFGLGTVTEHDATTYVPATKFNQVRLNPPFGSIHVVNYDGFAIKKLEHLIALKALEAMADDGTAYMILGAKLEEGPQGKGAQWVFENYLYSRYNVVDNFEVAGELYAKQGAKWPVRVIFIDGRRKMPLAGELSPKTVERLNTWDDVWKRAERIRNEIETRRQALGTGGAPGLPVPPGSAGTPPNQPGGLPPVPTGTPGAPARPGKPRPSGGRKPAIRGGPAGGGTAPPAGGTVPQPENVPQPAVQPGVGGNAAPRVEGGGGLAPGGAGDGSAGGAGGGAGTGPGVVPGSAAVTEGNLAALSDADIDALFDDAKGTPGAPAASGPTPGNGTKSGGKAPPSIKDVGSDAVEGMGDIIKGLSDLFGGGGSMGGVFGIPPFNEKTYAKARPMFYEAFQKFKAAGRSLKELAEYLVKQLGDGVRQYFKKFVDELRALIAENKPITPEHFMWSNGEVTKREAPPKVKNTEMQVRYNPGAEAPPFETLSPRNIAIGEHESVAKLKAKVIADGFDSLDAFVANRLGLEKSQVMRAFSGEQVDGVALAIDRMENGGALVIADQTGFGKGRQAAAVLWYAFKNGSIPVFFTKDPKLFSDMWGDLKDIVGDQANSLRPFIMGDVKKARVVLPKSDIIIHRAPTKRVQDREMARIRQVGMEAAGYNLIFATYSQVNDRNARQEFIEHLATTENATIVLDEAHEAAGDNESSMQAAFISGGQVERGKGADKVKITVPGLLNLPGTKQGRGGVLYLSATFAKRPDNMPLYFRTMLSQAADSFQDVVDAMEAGGVALQQAVSEALAKAGEFLRRERDFTGVSYDMVHLQPENKDKLVEHVDDVTNVLSEIVRFSHELVAAIKEENSALSGTALSQNALDMTEFAAIVHNQVGQLLLAVKADDVVKRVVDSFKAGEKPIVALTNTMESFLDHFTDDHRIKPGGPIKVRWNELLKHALSRTIRAKVKHPDGSTEVVTVNPADYGLKAEYDAIVALAEAIESRFPVSPIDYILQKIAKAGYKMHELTGRTSGVEYTDFEKGEGIYRKFPKADKNTIINSFNAEQESGMLLNAAGSTGLSAHASVKVDCQKPRHMLIAQPHLDINVFVQTLGRIFRTGMVLLGKDKDGKPYGAKYSHLVLPLQAELKPAAVAARKMKSLNANCTAEADAAIKIESVDFFNRYGDRIVTHFLDAHPKHQLGTGLMIDHNQDGEPKVQRDIARKFASRMALRPDFEQEAAYQEILPAYHELIEQLKATGDYDLEIVVHDDWDGKRQSDEELVHGTDPSNYLTSDVRVQQWEIKDNRPVPTGSQMMEEFTKRLSSPPDVADRWQKTMDTIAGAITSRREQLQRKLAEANRAINAAQNQTPEMAAAQHASLQAQGDLRLLDQTEQRWNTTRDQVSFILSDAGRIVELTHTKTGDMFEGMLVDMKLPTNARSTASAFRFKFAIDAPGGVLYLTAADFIGDDAWAKDSSDKQLKDFTGRKQGQRYPRYFIVGNPIRGHKAAGGRGKVVRFRAQPTEGQESSEGDIITGLLMPNAWTPANLAQDPRLDLVNGAAAAHFLTRYGVESDGTSVPINSADIVTIVKERGSSRSYAVSTGSSRSKGGKIYMADAVKAITGDFTKVGNRMRATVDERRLVQLIDVIQGITQQRFRPVGDRDTLMPQVSEANRRGTRQGDLAPINESALRKQGEEEMPDLEEEFERAWSSSQVNTEGEVFQDAIKDPEALKLYRAAYSDAPPTLSEFRQRAADHMDQFVNRLVRVGFNRSVGTPKERIQWADYVRKNHPELWHQARLESLNGAYPSNAQKAFALEKLKNLGLTDYGDLALEDWQNHREDVWTQEPGLAAWIEQHYFKGRDFGPIAEESQGHIGAIEPPATEQAPTVATSIEELRKALPTSGLSAKQQELLGAFLDTPLAKMLGPLTIKIQDALETGWQGSYFQRVAEIARNASDVTAPHELLHAAWEILPDELKAEFERMRVESLKTIPGGQSLIEQPTSGADEFLSRGLSRDLYPFSSPEEFFTHSASEQFKQKVGSQVEGFWARVKQFLADFLGAIKRALKLRRSQTEIIDDVLAGRFDPTAESGAEAERQDRQGALAPKDEQEALDQLKRELDEQGGGVPTQVFGETYTVNDRPQITPQTIASSSALAKNMLDGAGIKATEQDIPNDATHQNRRAWVMTPQGKDMSGEGQALIQRLQKEITEHDLGPKDDRLANILNSIVINFELGRRSAMSEMDAGTRLNLYTIAQTERSSYGIQLQALAGYKHDLVFVGRNLDIELGRAWSRAFGGDIVRGVVDDLTKVTKDLGVANVTIEQLRKALDDALRKRAPGLTKDYGSSGKIGKRIIEAIQKGGKLWDVLKAIAEQKGWKIPTDAELAQMKRWADELDKLQELTPAEAALAGKDKEELARLQREKTAATDARQAELRKQLETKWTRFTKSLSVRTATGRANLVNSLGEFVSANLLLKLGFATRQTVDVLTQGAMYTPTRAISHAIGLHQKEVAAGRRTSADVGKLIADCSDALKQAYEQRTKALRASFAATGAVLRGAEAGRNFAHLMDRISLFDRAMQKADEMTLAGRHGEAFLLRLFTHMRWGYRVAQAMDNLHGVPAVYQEMRQQVVAGMRANGMSPAEADQKADWAMGDMKAEFARAYPDAQAWLERNGVDANEAAIKMATWRLVTARQYERIRTLGLPADDFAGRNRELLNTVGWNLPEKGGVGGAVADVMRTFSKLAPQLGPLGIPLVTMTRFGNAMGILINRKLAFTPLGFFPGAFGVDERNIDSQSGIASGGSPWFRTAEDRRQRKVEASVGSTVGLGLLLLAATGAIRVLLSWPKDKAEKDKWDQLGWRPGQVHLMTGPDSYITLSMNTGPFAVVSPWLAAGGAVHDLATSREKEQQRMNARAEKLGVEPGKVRPLSMGDLLATAATAMWGGITSGRTISGLVGSVSDYGGLNVRKASASVLSALSPGLPGLQEIARLQGVVLDAKMASVWDFMFPLPTSGAAQVNLLGDPVGSANAAQRVIQTLTGGNYPFPVSDKENAMGEAYKTLFASGYRPPAINPNAAYQIDGQYRPLTNRELAEYTAKRGEYFKDELNALGEGASLEETKSAFGRANARALGEIGVSTGAKMGSKQGANTPGSAQQPSQPATGGGNNVPTIGGGSSKRSISQMRRFSSVRKTSIRRGLGVRHPAAGIRRPGIHGVAARPGGTGRPRKSALRLR